jgi:hypothetical protein
MMTPSGSVVGSAVIPATVSIAESLLVVCAPSPR